jgi:hypothetical protein
MNDTVNTGVTVFCGQCGHKNAPGFNFCQSCGTQAGLPQEDASAGQTDNAAAQPSMTLLKAVGIYAAAILLHIALFNLFPNGIVLAYLACGFVMTRIVMGGLIEWHPNFNTLDNVVGSKMSMFALWPIQMPTLLLKLIFNKVM